MHELLELFVINRLGIVEVALAHELLGLLFRSRERDEVRDGDVARVVDVEALEDLADVFFAEVELALHRACDELAVIDLLVARHVGGRHQRLRRVAVARF